MAKVSDKGTGTRDRLWKPVPLVIGSMVIDHSRSAVAGLGEAGSRCPRSGSGAGSREGWEGGEGIGKGTSNLEGEPPCSLAMPRIVIGKRGPKEGLVQAGSLSVWLRVPTSGCLVVPDLDEMRRGL